MGASDPSATPWPWNGCTLAEARQRTADRELWKEYLLRLRRYTQVDISGSFAEAREQLRYRHELYMRMKLPKGRINHAFRQHLSTGRLIATGRPHDITQPPQIVRGRRLAPVRGGSTIGNPPHTSHGKVAAVM